MLYKGINIGRQEMCLPYKGCSSQYTAAYRGKSVIGTLETVKRYIDYWTEGVTHTPHTPEEIEKIILPVEEWVEVDGELKLVTTEGEVITMPIDERCESIIPIPIEKRKAIQKPYLKERVTAPIFIIIIVILFILYAIFGKMGGK